MYCRKSLKKKEYGTLIAWAAHTLGKKYYRLALYLWCICFFLSCLVDFLSYNISFNSCFRKNLGLLGHLLQQLFWTNMTRTAMRWSYYSVQIFLISITSHLLYPFKYCFCVLYMLVMYFYTFASFYNLSKYHIDA